MNKTRLEKYLVVILFVLVFVVFSFAQSDTKKLEQLYTTTEARQKTKEYTTSLAPVNSYLNAVIYQ